MAYRLILPVAVLGAGAIRVFENPEAGCIWMALALALWYLALSGDEIAFLKARNEALRIELAKFYRKKEQ